ncbi:MAG: hypothetical protein K9M99_05345 [Candidatus Cloacimonetes bacterium]|nr:hypothetical protein [Candidatus Cloacimonadota bacterium]
MSFGKKCFNFLCLGGFAYLGYKAYSYITGLINISKELPVYLKNVIGETPSMNINMVFNRITISLSFSAKTIAKHPDIADTTLEYITKYYPVFRPDRIVIEIDQKLEAEPEAEIAKEEEPVTTD